MLSFSEIQIFSLSLVFVCVKKIPIVCHLTKTHFSTRFYCLFFFLLFSGLKPNTHRINKRRFFYEMQQQTNIWLDWSVKFVLILNGIITIGKSMMTGSGFGHQKFYRIQSFRFWIPKFIQIHRPGEKNEHKPNTWTEHWTFFHIVVNRSCLSFKGLCCLSFQWFHEFSLSI